ncbi:MAG TPA: hypothetical protein VGJ63_07305 [Micromonosporaceae bacterium]|jgi:hypothetical protein
MAKLTITVPDAVADAAKRLARERGTSVSAMAARGLREQVAAAAALAYDAWLDANPTVAIEVGDWRAITHEHRQQRWAHLGETTA